VIAFVVVIASSAPTTPRVCPVINTRNGNILHCWLILRALPLSVICSWRRDIPIKVRQRNLHGRQFTTRSGNILLCWLILGALPLSIICSSAWRRDIPIKVRQRNLHRRPFTTRSGNILLYWLILVALPLASLVPDQEFLGFPCEHFIPDSTYHECREHVLQPK